MFDGDFPRTYCRGSRKESLYREVWKKTNKEVNMSMPTKIILVFGLGYAFAEMCRLAMYIFF